MEYKKYFNGLLFSTLLILIQYASFLCPMKFKRVIKHQLLMLNQTICTQTKSSKQILLLEDAEH